MQLQLTRAAAVTLPLRCAGAVGLCSFLLLRPIDYAAGSPPPPVDPNQSTLAEVQATFAMVFEKRVLLL